MNEEIICYCNLLGGKLKRKKNNNTWKEEEGNYGKMEERIHDLLNPSTMLVVVYN